MNRLEPYFTEEFRRKLEEAETERLGNSAALALQEEIDWKLVAKKRVNASSPLQ